MKTIGEKITVKFKKDSPYSEYGYYKRGDIGNIIGFTNCCAVILKDDGSFVKAELNWIEEYIDPVPELSESENEKIRKKLIEAVKGDMVVGGTKDKAKAIAWLEKQGEQSVEWSEEDKSRLASVIEDMEDYYEHNYNKHNSEWPSMENRRIILDEINNNIIWLKSLKDRVGCEANCTTTKEWSEEDEKMLAEFLHKVEVCDLLTNREDVWITKKLKSLRPQKQWKPSEEQLEALKDSARGLYACKDKNLLLDLYEQLKAL